MLKKANTSFDEFGTPICPIDKTPFTFLGKSGGKNCSARFKWVCHKSKPCGTSRICTCETPCTESSYGKCTYTYPDDNFRLYPSIPRNTEHWERLYNVRVVIERTINLFKDTFGVASLKTQNETTIKTDLYLAGITQLIGVILAKELQKRSETYICSLINPYHLKHSRIQRLICRACFFISHFNNSIILFFLLSDVCFF